MDEQGLIVVKDNFLSKVARFLRRIFSRKQVYNDIVENKEEEQITIEYIKPEKETIQEEILRARSAFRKYVINNNKNISLDILNYIDEKLTENKDEIVKIIEINGDNVTFDEIKKILQKEKKTINQFKRKNEKTGCYQVPVGVIGIECADSKECITNMIKSITTRNSIIVLDENYSRYSTQALILLIIKECLRNFYVDDDIVQMFEEDEIDVTKLDKLIKSTKAGNKDDENDEDNEYDENDEDVIKAKIKECIKDDLDDDNVIYFYQEDDSFEDVIRNQIKKLRNIDEYKNYTFKAIEGEFGNIINFLNSRKPFAVCMYTNNSQKAYKFINWVNSGNVFVNTGIVSCKEIVNNKNEYVNFKYVLHEDVF